MMVNEDEVVRVTTTVVVPVSVTDGTGDRCWV
jgi:hypothetical protein